MTEAKGGATITTASPSRTPGHIGIHSDNSAKVMVAFFKLLKFCLQLFIHLCWFGTMPHRLLSGQFRMPHARLQQHAPAGEPASLSRRTWQRNMDLIMDLIVSPSLQREPGCRLRQCLTCARPLRSHTNATNARLGCQDAR